MPAHYMNPVLDLGDVQLTVASLGYYKDGRPYVAGASYHYRRADGGWSVNLRHAYVTRDVPDVVNQNLPAIAAQILVQRRASLESLQTEVNALTAYLAENPVDAPEATSTQG